MRSAVERVGSTPRKVAIVVIQATLGEVFNIEIHLRTRTADTGVSLRLIVIDNKITNRGTIAVFVTHHNARVPCRYANRAKVFILSRQKVQRRNITLDVVLDQRQEVTQLDKVGQVIRRTNGARTGEIGRRGSIMEPGMSGTLNHGGLTVMCGTVVEMKGLTKLPATALVTC